MSELVTRNSRQLQELRHRLASQTPQHQLERYRDQILQMERLLTLKNQGALPDKAADAKRLSEALLMLDTSRIVARGYALVQAGDQVLDSVDTIKRKGCLDASHAGWASRSRGKACRKKRNLKKI